MLWMDADLPSVAEGFLVSPEAVLGTSFPPNIFLPSWVQAVFGAEGCGFLLHQMLSVLEL